MPAAENSGSFCLIAGEGGADIPVCGKKSTPPLADRNVCPTLALLTADYSDLSPIAAIEELSGGLLGCHGIGAQPEAEMRALLDPETLAPGMCS